MPGVSGADSSAPSDLVGVVAIGLAVPGCRDDFALTGASTGLLALFLRGGSLGLVAGRVACSSGMRSAMWSLWGLIQEWTFLKLRKLLVDDLLENRRVGLRVRIRGVGGACEFVQLHRVSSSASLSELGEPGEGLEIGPSEDGGTSRVETFDSDFGLSSSCVARLILTFSVGLVDRVCVISGG